MEKGGEKAMIPRTSGGGKFNSVTHGLRANSRLLPGESPIAFGKLRSKLLRQFAPVGPAERILVEQVAEALWRLRRVAAVEAGLYALSYNSRCRKRVEDRAWKARYGRDEEEPEERELLGEAWVHHSKSFLHLARYRTSVERPLAKNIRDLAAMQAARLGKAADGGEVINLSRDGDSYTPRTANGREETEKADN
jgi:hypothetical protein